MQKIYFLPILFTFLIAPFAATSQIEVNQDFTAEETILDFFDSGVLTEVSNITFNGMSGDQISAQIGVFWGGYSTDFNIDAGLVMATANASESFEGLEYEFQIFDNYPDQDIIDLTNGANVNDCAVIEFDAVISGDAVVFNYVFGSNEYESFTCSVFNDAFGLFISGPGINGPFANNAKNIAIVPDTDSIPVAINSVNGGVPTGVGSEATCAEMDPNWQDNAVYFVENLNPDTGDVAFNGYTTMFEAYSEVEFGEVYHFKFAICDVLDGALDSGVFLEAGSFKGIMISDTEEPDAYDLNLFPNPSSNGLVTIKDENLLGSQIQVIDLQGRVVFQEQVNTELQYDLDISGLSSGVYLTSLTKDGRAIARTKLVVE